MAAKIDFAPAGSIAGRLAPCRTGLPDRLQHVGKPPPRIKPRRNAHAKMQRAPTGIRILARPPMSGHRLTMLASQLQDLIVATLVKQVGGTQRRWRIALGPVHVRDSRSYPPCNWEVRPNGTPRENAAIERLLDVLRLEHPAGMQG